MSSILGPGKLAMRSKSILGLLVLGACAIGLERGIASACPTSCVRLPGNVDFCTPAAAFDTTLADTVCCHCGQSRTAFNVPAGTLYAMGWSSWDGCEPRVTVEDDFVVGGLPIGTPVSFTARLALTLHASSFMGPGFASASLTEGASNTVAVNWDDVFYSSQTRSDVLMVPVTAIVGTPFHMKYFVRAYAGELTSAEWQGTFDFANLPGGASITSCKGYSQAAVPAQSASWGRMKAAYR
jgi:hypothetical protein